MLDQVDAIVFDQIGQVIEQACFPTLVGVCQAEGSQNVDFTGQNSGVDRSVAVGVVAVGVQNNFNIGIDLVESSDHGVHALAALEGDVEIDSALHGSGILINDPTGVHLGLINALLILNRSFGFNGSCNGVVCLGGIGRSGFGCATGSHGQNHNQSQQHSNQLFHCIFLHLCFIISGFSANIQF